MKVRKVLKISVFILILLFVFFSIVEVKGSVTIFLSLFSFLTLIRVVEFITFFRKKKNYLKLGDTKVFNPILKNIITIILIIVIVKVFLKYNFVVPDFQTSFSDYFGDMRFFYALMISLIIKDFILDERIYFLYGKNILTHGNIYPSYELSDFKNYLIIKEQNLIRLKKRNNKFLFIEYDEEYFDKNKNEIIERLDEINKDNG